MQSVVSKSQPSFSIGFDLWSTANKRLHERRRSKAKVAWHRASIKLRELICCYSDPRHDRSLHGPGYTIANNLLLYYLWPHPTTTATA